MIRKRFPKERRWRVVAWTGLAVAWGTTLIARTVGAPAAEPAEPVAVSPPPPPTTSAPAQVTASVPEMPDDGLVILRFTPGPEPEPVVERIVVSRPAVSSGTATAPAPTTKQSSGS